MDFVEIAFLLCVAYVVFCKAWPYLLYPNYLRKSKVENYPELVELASKLKNADKFKTLQNVYAYMQETYVGHSEVLSIRNLLSVFLFGDFATYNVLGKSRFLWCHTQNRLFKSILMNTGVFEECDIVIKKRILSTFFIHQWLQVDLADKIIKIDPYYGLFDTNTRPALR